MNTCRMMKQKNHMYGKKKGTRRMIPQCATVMDASLFGKNQVFLDLQPSVISAVDVFLVCPPTDPGRLSVKLLGILIPQDILACSNCTEAKCREMVNPKILQAIKGEYCYVLNVYNLLFFPLNSTCRIHVSTVHNKGDGGEKSQ